MYQLADISTRAPEDADKKEYKNEKKKILNELNELQNLLYAESKHALLVILQGPDASGKDGTIRKVFGKLNPQGVKVQSFKAPSTLELSHDFLWRVHQFAPAKGMIQIFNRSHYEDVLVTRVNGWCDDALAIQRFAAINDFEKLLTDHNATQIIKIYLHVSHDEQKERLKERIENPMKHWKYNKMDFKESSKWDKYRKVYEDVFEKTSAIPWKIVPADQNWYKEYMVAKIVLETLQNLNMSYPTLEEVQNGTGS